MFVAAGVGTIFEFRVRAGSSSQLVVRTRVVAMRPPLHAMGRSALGGVDVRVTGMSKDLHVGRATDEN